ncbi:hypothetical protein J6590_077073 [Homalodisca vitripennis]|nr:hypothetical protein J6590_077073 [Homalodisca vitripennis]
MSSVRPGGRGGAGTEGRSQFPRGDEPPAPPQSERQDVLISAPHLSVHRRPIACRVISVEKAQIGALFVQLACTLAAAMPGSGPCLGHFTCAASSRLGDEHLDRWTNTSYQPRELKVPMTWTVPHQWHCPNSQEGTPASLAQRSARRRACDCIVTVTGCSGRIARRGGRDGIMRKFEINIPTTLPLASSASLGCGIHGQRTLCP